MSDNRNYIAAWQDYKTDKVVVLERDQEGKLYRKRYNSPYYFYVPDDEGTEVSIFKDKVTRLEFDTYYEYEAAKKQFPKKFESDFTPVKRILMDNYYEKPTPPVNFAFLDIENDYRKSIGWARPTNPYAIINAVTIYQSWTDKFLTYVVPPEGWTGTVDDIYLKLAELIEAKQLREDQIPEITICVNEFELLNKMLTALEPADIISGWNSEFFDIPYIAERLLQSGGEHMLGRLEHLGANLPKKELVNRFGTDEPIYNMTGKSHIDYMKAFQKFTFEGRTSYALGNILEEEVGMGKLEYDGTLEELYNNDFPLFTCYNFRDVSGILDLNKKFKFIAIINQMAHESTVVFSAMMGTVAYVETAITNHAHYVMKQVVHDKIIKVNDKVEGAIVLTPRVGLHEMGGAVDIKSLYPNVCRSLNISPEMIVGQFEDNEDAFTEIRNLTDKELVFVQENGQEWTKTAIEWKAFLIEQCWAISAYGTVFDQGHGKGVIADILGFWYNERLRLQAEKSRYIKLEEKETNPTEKVRLQKLVEYYDLLQLTKKIQMNSLYGALLAASFRFGDKRMGASVTGSGRIITEHMIYDIEKNATGIPKKFAKVRGKIKKGKKGAADHDTFHYIIQRSQLETLRKAKKLLNPRQQLPESFIDFEACIYSDTDSCYFNTGADNKDEAIKIANKLSDLTNATFPDFMADVFNCQPDFNKFISASREVVFSRGIFLAKKKYVLRVIDLDGKTVNKIKAMGSEIKKADTPKIIQSFLKTTVEMILDGKSYDDVCVYVNEQRKDIIKQKLKVFLLGVAKQVNDLDKYTAEYLHPGSQTEFDEDTGKAKKLTITGHARAACNYNFLLDIFDKGNKPISSGDKVLVFYLKPNDFKFTSLAFPAEMTHFPDWFLENFTVDRVKTEDKMFDSKLEGIFAALGKDVPSPQSVLTNSILTF